MPEATLPGLVAELVASRHAGGYRFKVQERVLQAAQQRYQALARVLKAPSRTRP